MALGCRLTSVRGNRGENYENEPLVRKNIKKIFFVDQPASLYARIKALSLTRRYVAPFPFT
jgi:hypothetical protein